MAAMFVTKMQNVPALLGLIIVHVRKDLRGMDARVQVSLSIALQQNLASKKQSGVGFISVSRTCLVITAPLSSIM